MPLHTFGMDFETEFLGIQNANITQFGGLPLCQKELDILYPVSPGSIYHMTKTQDALLFYFYNKNVGLDVGSEISIQEVI